MRSVFVLALALSLHAAGAQTPKQAPTADADEFLRQGIVNCEITRRRRRFFSFLRRWIRSVRSLRLHKHRHGQNNHQ
jgi:hypothetical protein